MDKILSSPTPLTNEIQKDDQDENSLGLHSDAYAQSSQASAVAAQKPATDAVAQPASLPVGNALLRTSTADVVPGLELINPKSAPKAAEPAPVPASDALLRMDRFSPAKVSDLSHSLISGTAGQKLMMSDFRSQLNISQLYSGKHVPASSSNVSIFAERVPLANRLDLTKANGGLSSLLTATTFEVRQAASTESRAASESKRSQTLSTDRAQESKPLESKLQDSRVSTSAVVESKPADSQAHSSKPAELKPQDSKPSESGALETRSTEPRIATRATEPSSDARGAESRFDVRSAEPTIDTKAAEPRLVEQRIAEQRIAEQRIAVRFAEPGTENSHQPGRQSQPGDVKLAGTVAGRSEQTVAQSGLESAVNQSDRRPATKGDDTAANTTKVDNSGSLPETKVDVRPSSTDLSINNGATDNQLPALSVRRHDSQRQAESAIVNGSERQAIASAEGQKRAVTPATTDSGSLTEGKPPEQSKPLQHILTPGSQRVSGLPESQLLSKIVPVDATSDKRAAAPSSSATDVVIPAQSVPKSSDRRETISLTVGSTMGQSVKQLLEQTSRPVDSSTRASYSPEGTFTSPFERDRRPAARSVVDELDAGRFVRAGVARVQPEKGLGKDCQEGDQHKGKQPKSPSEASRTGEATTPATIGDRIVTAPKVERPFERPTTNGTTPKADGTTPKTDTSVKPRTEAKPGSETATPAAPREPVKVSGAYERPASNQETRGPRQETVKPTDAIPPKSVDSVPGTRPAEQTKPAEIKPTDTKLTVPVKPADSAFVSQIAGDRLFNGRSDTVPAKQQDGTIIRDSLPRPASNVVAAGADRGITSAAQQAVVNGQNDKALRPSTSPAQRAQSDPAGGILANILNSEKPLSRQLSPSAGELIVRNLPEYLGNQGQRVSQAGHQLADRIFDKLIRDDKAAQPPGNAKPHPEVGKLVSSLLKPIADFKPVADQKLPPVKEAPKAVAQPAKPFDFVAPAKADSIRVATDTTKPVTSVDVSSGRALDAGRKPQLPIVDATRTPKSEVKGTVKGDAPRALQENSGTRVNTGFRPVKESKTSTDASAPAVKNPMDRTVPAVKVDGTKPTRADSTVGTKVSAPQDIKVVTTTKADVNGLPRRDAKQIVSETAKDVKAVEVKAAGIKPVDVAGAIKASSPRAINVDNVNAGRKADSIDSGRRADAVNAGRKADQATTKTDAKVNRTDSTRIVKGDSVPVVKVDTSRVNRVDVARVIKADQPQANIGDRNSKVVAVGDRNSKVIVAKNDSRSIKTETTIKGDATKPATVKPATVDLTKFDLSKSAKAEVIRSIKSSVPQLAEQIKVVKSDVPQTAKIDANGLRKVDAAKVIKSDVAKSVEPKTVKIDASSVKKPEVANIIKADAVKFNTGRPSESKVAVRVVDTQVPTSRVAETANGMLKVENRVQTARVESNVSAAKAESNVSAAKAESKVSAAKAENKVTAAKAENAISPARVDKRISSANIEIGKAVDVKLTGAKLSPIDTIQAVKVDVAQIKGDRATVAINKVSEKAESRRILKGDKTSEAKVIESKDSSQAVWPIEGLLVRGRVGAIQIKEAEEITSTLKVSQEFEEYLYEDETSDYGSDAYFFPGLKAALKFCEVVGLVELEEKLEQQKKDSEGQEVKRTLSPTRVRYEVKPGDTLQSIAIEKLGDARFVDLIVTINRSEVTFRTENGIRVPLVFAGQLLWLPSEQERSIYQKHYFSGKAGKNGSPSVQISTGEDSATRTAAVSAQQKLHSEALREQFAPQADSKATRLQPKRLPSDSTPIAQTLEKLRFAGNRQSVRWNEVSTGDPISGRESYQVKLGETLQSIALNHPRMGDVRFWVVIATLNDLPRNVDQYGQPIAIIENGQLLVLPTALELIDFCTTGNITGPVRRSRSTGRPGSAGDTVVVPNLAVSVFQVLTEKIVDVRNFTPTARMIVSESSTDMDQFSVKLQVVVGYEWKLIASYDSFRGTATRTRYGINGIKATMRLNLPLSVVREMAIEDFSRNWTFHRDAFEANRPESRERTSGFNLRPVV